MLYRLDNLWTCVCVFPAWRQVFSSGLTQQWQSGSQQVIGLWDQNSASTDALCSGKTHTENTWFQNKNWTVIYSDVDVALGDEHKWTLQHNDNNNHQCDRWGRPVPTVPALHSSLSQSQQPHMCQSSVHRQHHSDRAGTPCGYIKTSSCFKSQLCSPRLRLFEIRSNQKYYEIVLQFKIAVFYVNIY